MVLLHGLEGSSDAGYFHSLAQAALSLGFGVHRTNMRTCGGTERLSDTMYHSGLTSDTLFLLHQLTDRFCQPILLVGFSLGGNVTLKLLGEIGDSNVVTAGCAVSTPINLAECVRTLDKPSNRLYARRFLSRLKDRVRRKSVFSPDHYSTSDLAKISSIWEFDDRFTAPLFGFGTAENYYRTQSSLQYLKHVRIPTLLITAKDDPMVPFKVYEDASIANNPSLELLAVERGGHLGFISRRQPRFWLDGVILGWFERILQSKGLLRGTNASLVSSQR